MSKVLNSFSKNLLFFSALYCFKYDKIPQHKTTGLQVLICYIII